VGGIVARVHVDNLTDRLWDQQDPLDVAGSLRAPLADYPELPALVWLQVAPTWIAHDYFVWSLPLQTADEPGQPPSRRETARSSTKTNGKSSTQASDSPKESSAKEPDDPKRRRRRGN
jgi:hypothetical protein